MLRISQGFLHMGKGLIGFAPYLLHTIMRSLPPSLSLSLSLSGSVCLCTAGHGVDSPVRRYHGERSLMSPVAVSGLLIFMHMCSDLKTLMLGGPLPPSLPPPPPPSFPPSLLPFFLCVCVRARASDSVSLYQANGTG